MAAETSGTGGTAANEQTQLDMDFLQHMEENTQREITSVSQGSQSVVTYFTRLKMLWDELACLMPTHGCSCGLCICGYGKLNAEAHTLNQLMQFFMGLNDGYDHLRDQIFVMEPLPSVNKAYSSG
ncbi:UNVERIFIED_CONTAM: hypothetical protein Sradi_3954900 [Sesamum radiatum]|uniref:Retrotransposon gag domain-containing protein n=1 Tax=Sesamum radiatum TaxID=300843 RepID=A0AAW2PFL5_SESRA